MSRGTSISTGPISVSTVLARAIARVPAASPSRIVLVISEVLGHLRVQGGLQHLLVDWLSNPFGPSNSTPRSLVVSCITTRRPR